MSTPIKNQVYIPNLYKRTRRINVTNANDVTDARNGYGIASGSIPE